ncbi:MAG TPA: hypothetical protein VLC46_14725 [Thermoanaerobaculia bacterium]|jgi:hypothetical protein|nr:hypothetical protein [Thermoanaerobaculia bacterium]
MSKLVLTRETAVARLRRKLIAQREEGKSVCRMAAEKNIFCRGFLRDNDDDLRFRYAAAIDDAARLTREGLEERANVWQIERQRQEGALLCCDVQYMGYETCRAWDDFSNEELSRFCAEMLGENVRVTGKVSPAVL